MCAHPLPCATMSIWAIPVYPSHAHNIRHPHELHAARRYVHAATKDTCPRYPLHGKVSFHGYVDFSSICSDALNLKDRSDLILTVGGAHEISHVAPCKTIHRFHCSYYSSARYTSSYCQCCQRIAPQWLCNLLSLPHSVASPYGWDCTFKAWIKRKSESCISYLKHGSEHNARRSFRPDNCVVK